MAKYTILEDLAVYINGSVEIISYEKGMESAAEIDMDRQLERQELQDYEGAEFHQ